MDVNNIIITMLLVLMALWLVEPPTSVLTMIVDILIVTVIYVFVWFF
jgi:hypothetical protein